MILEREGEVLEALLFKLVETHLLLDAGEARFLPRATREVERARTRAREVGLLRATTVAIVAPGATLRTLAGTANSPWPAILRDHHEVLTRLLAEIEVAAHQNAITARDGLDELCHDHASDATPAPCGTGTRVASGGVHGGPVDPSGRLHGRPVRDAALDHLARGAALEAVLGTAARLHMPDLVDFLR